MAGPCPVRKGTGALVGRRKTRLAGREGVGGFERFAWNAIEESRFGDFHDCFGLGLKALTQT